MQQFPEGSTPLEADSDRTLLIKILNKLNNVPAAGGGSLIGTVDPNGNVMGNPGETYLNSSKPSFWVQTSATASLTGWAQLICFLLMFWSLAALGQGTAVRSNNGQSTNLTVCSGSSIGTPALSIVDQFGDGPLIQGLVTYPTGIGKVVKSRGLRIWRRVARVWSRCVASDNLTAIAVLRDLREQREHEELPRPRTARTQIAIGFSYETLWTYIDHRILIQRN